MRKRIYEIIEVDNDNDLWSKVYDFIMMVLIIVSIIPMISKKEYFTWVIADRICVTVFIVDYIMRWATADFKLKESKHPFLTYPFTLMAIVDLLSILPSLTRLNKALKAFRLTRLMRAMQVFRALRVFKTFRYSKNYAIVSKVIKDSWDSLVTVIMFVVAYIFVSALVVFNVEPDTFKSFFEALYWATISLATVGYGDITPVTPIGRFVTMISAIMGVAIIALPSGIITAGFMKELEEKEEEKKENQEGNK